MYRDILAEIHDRWFDSIPLAAAAHIKKILGDKVVQRVVDLGRGSGVFLSDIQEIMDKILNKKSSMEQQLRLSDFKQGIADFYDSRSQSYDNNTFQILVCRHLLAYSPVSTGQNVLDIGTGTGHLAIASAKIVQKQGRVIGVDISPKMLKQARNKISRLGLHNIEFQLSDAEILDYPKHYFDHILCANTFPWMKDKKATLQMWLQFLKPGERIAVNTPADTAYTGTVILRKVFAKHGFDLEASNRIGSIKQCQDLFGNAGFEDIEIKTEQHGKYTTLDQVKAAWESSIVNPSITSPQFSGDGLAQLSSSQLAQIKAEFDEELESLQTQQGIWDDLNTWYILGRKSKNSTL